MKKFVVVNECYGGFPNGIDREYSSREEFEKTIGHIMLLTKEQIEKKYFGAHPLDCSDPVLYELDLAEGESYRIDEYDGFESLHIYKTAVCTSVVKRLDSCVSDIKSWKDEQDKQYAEDEYE